MRYIIILSLFFIFSCSYKLKKEDIVGKWKVVKYEAEGLNRNMEAQFKKVALSTYYLFEEDGTWEAKNDQSLILGGDWNYSLEKEELILTTSLDDYEQVWSHTGIWKFECEEENLLGKDKRVIRKQ